ncbi:MAG: hypothetical protein L0154_16430, partial [Chloroflexi bacterium]|nr:hypothetical protein [Chloroflexota bacterium]
GSRVGRTLVTEDGGVSIFLTIVDLFYDVITELHPPVMITGATSIAEGAIQTISISGFGFKPGEMASQSLLIPSLHTEERCDHLVQLHHSCLKLMTFSRWIGDYVCRFAGPDSVNVDNILSPDHTPDVMLFHVMRECRSPMTALIGYTDMLLSLHAFTDEQRVAIVEKINRCCQTIHERSRDMTQFIEMWLEETNRDSITHQPDLVFGEVLRFPQFYAELINCTYLAFMPDIEHLTSSLQDDPQDAAALRQIFDYGQYVNCILRHSYDFFR